MQEGQPAPNFELLANDGNSIHQHGQDIANFLNQL